MEKKKLVFTGVEGYCTDETFSVRVDDIKLVGRSRSCDFSMRKMNKWLSASDEEREESTEFRSISRRHLKVQLLCEGEEYTVKFTDLSRNGTFVDQDRIGPVFELKGEAMDEKHYVRLGDKETFEMVLTEDTGEEDPGQQVDPELADVDDGEDEEVNAAEENAEGDVDTGREAKEDASDEDGDDSEEK